MAEKPKPLTAKPRPKLTPKPNTLPASVRPVSTLQVGESVFHAGHARRGIYTGTPTSPENISGSLTSPKRSSDSDVLLRPHGVDTDDNCNAREDMASTIADLRGTHATEGTDAPKCETGINASVDVQTGLTNEANDAVNSNDLTKASETTSNKGANEPNVKLGDRCICGVCGNGLPVAYCETCPLFMCASCRKAHEKFVPGEHLISDIDIQESQETICRSGDCVEPVIQCRVHKSLYCEFICRACMELICETCVKTKHARHAVASFEESLSHLQTLCFENIKVLVDASSSLENKQSELGIAGKAPSFTEAISEIQARKEKIEQALRNISNSLTEELDTAKFVISRSASQGVETITATVKLAKELDSQLTVARRLQSPSDIIFALSKYYENIDIILACRESIKIPVTPKSSTDILCDATAMDDVLKGIEKLFRYKKSFKPQIKDNGAGTRQGKSTPALSTTVKGTVGRNIKWK